jgi:hypothetical protein
MVEKDQPGQWTTCPRDAGGCGASFFREKGSRRRRCETCSPSRLRSRAGDVVKPAVRPLHGPEDAGPEVRAMGPIESAVLRELQARDRAETVQGQVALKLAAELEARTHSGSQSAALAGRLMEAQAAALRGAPRERDAVDQLEERRRARREAAAGA